MKSIYLMLVIAFCITGYWPVAVNGVCDVCQDNGAACINETSFHLCFGHAQPTTSQTFICSEGLVCTDRTVICMQSSLGKASCGDTSNCGICNKDRVFACTSRNTYSFCFGATQPTHVNGTCPDGLICDASKQEICVQTTVANSIICDINTPIDVLSYDIESEGQKEVY